MPILSNIEGKYRQKEVNQYKKSRKDNRYDEFFEKLGFQPQIQSDNQSDIFFKPKTQEMGKKDGSYWNTPKKVSPPSINLSKSFSANLHTYQKYLKQNHSQLTSKQYISRLHHFIKKCGRKGYQICQETLVKVANKVGVCQHCDGWELNNHSMLRCSTCEDLYHLSCMNESKVRENWLCSVCEHLEQKKQSEGTSSPPNTCEECGEETSCELLSCLRCSKSFHPNCLFPCSRICKPCQQQLQAKIGQYHESFEPKVPQNHTKNKEQSEKYPFKSKNIFQHNFPDFSKSSLKQYKSNLLHAILTKKMQYEQQLIPLAPTTLTNPQRESLDFGMMELCQKDYKKYLKYKEQPIGPFRLVWREGMGYDVIADCRLEKGTIVCEYVGDVYSHRQVIERGWENDSIMELRKGINSEERLFIVPSKYSNIARFINGIKNGSRQKPNLQTIRALVDEKPVVILYTCSTIQEGETIRYDYNAGRDPVGYDTSGFI